MPNIESIKKYKNIHMIGIGGVSMSGIAAILTKWGFNVTGSEIAAHKSIPAAPSVLYSGKTSLCGNLSIFKIVILNSPYLLINV